MLPDRELQLLTAYVDGEISARERERVTRLLQTSSAARTALQLLQSDARAVRELTRLKLGPDFPDKVMRTLARSGIGLPPPRPPAPAPWIGMAIAASIFVMIAAASYWYFAPNRPNVRPGPDALAGKQLEGVFGRFSAAAIHLAAADLATENARKTLVTNLHQDNAYHVDLAVQDNGRAIQGLTATLKQCGIQLIMGAGMEQDLKQQKGKISYFLFAENLTPEELVRLLQQLGAQSSGRQDAGVNRVIVDLMTAEHRQKLSSFLDVGRGNAPAAGQAKGDPLSDLLNKRIIAGNRAGQGPSPIKLKAEPPSQERFALVLASPHGDLTALGESPELRTYMSRRREQVPGTLQVFLVIHEASV
jgi:hypothetical protein